MTPPTPTTPPQAQAGWPERATRMRLRLGRALWWWQVASIVLALIWFCAVVPLRFDLTFPEGAVVAGALDVADGRGPYHDWREWPHSFAPYGPLTYAVPGGLVRAFGPGPEARLARVWSGYLAGRLVSLGSLCVLLAAVGLAVQRAGVGWWWAVPGLALALRWQSVWQYCTSLRPDAPRTALCVLALALALGRPATPRRVALVFGLVWLSFWFKPVGLAVLAALLAWVGLEHGWRRAAGVGLAFAGSGLALFAALDGWWGGRLRLNMLDSMDNGFQFDYLKLYFSHFAKPVDYALPLLALAAAGLAWWTVRQPRARGPLQRRLLPLWLALALSYLLALAQGLKVGADLNYFLEPLALMAAGLGVLLPGAWRPRRRWPGRLPLLREAVLWLGVVPWLVFDVAGQASFLPQQLRTIRRQYTPFPIARVVEGLPGPVLAGHPWLVLHAGDPRSVLDYFQYRNLVERGRLDAAPLRSRLAAGAFSAVILSDAEQDREKALATWSGLFGPGFYDALQATYTERGNIAIFHIFTPRSAPPP